MNKCFVYFLIFKHALAQGRENYRKYSACDPRFVDSVRLPLLQELPENNEKTGDKVSTAENELG